MSVKYKLIQRKNLKTKELEWYATPNTARPRAKEGDKTSKNASTGSTISDAETQATLRQVGKYIPQALLNGESVKIPGVGSFRISFHSKGAKDIRNFRAQSMISGARILFTPDNELRDHMLRGISWELNGVKDGNREYANVRTYLLAKGIITEEEDTTDPGTGTLTPDPGTNTGGDQGGGTGTIDTGGGGSTPTPTPGGNDGENDGGD